MGFMIVSRGVGSVPGVKRVAVPVVMRRPRAIHPLALPDEFARIMRGKHRRRGMGQVLADPFTTKGQLQRGQLSDTAYADSAVNYPEAPTCNVVDLSRNMCAYDNGLIDGCNAIQDCDALTGAVHGQYGLPGGPIAGQPSTLRTVGPAFQFPVFGYSPNLALKNPASTPTPVVFQSDAQIQANIQKALGPTLYKAYQAAQGIPGSSGGGSSSGGPASSASGNNAASASIPNPNAQSTLPLPASAGFDFSFFTKPISLFGFSIPLWALLAAGGAGLYAFSGGHRR